MSDDAKADAKKPEEAGKEAGPRFADQAEVYDGSDQPQMEDVNQGSSKVPRQATGKASDISEMLRAISAEMKDAPPTPKSQDAGS
mmetsp:Transcript_21642/g.46316  ORF Transcript_21642/g.46316 Transcript_21642/m.46316 type:complete len:85 (+) Transcript_21642:67-321(+)